MTCAPGQHDWQPAPEWVIAAENRGGAATALAYGYKRLWCWRCHLVVDVKEVRYG